VLLESLFCGPPSNWKWKFKMGEEMFSSSHLCCGPDSGFLTVSVVAMGNICVVQLRSRLFWFGTFQMAVTFWFCCKTTEGNVVNTMSAKQKVKN